MARSEDLLAAITRIEAVVRQRVGEILDPSLAAGRAGAAIFLASLDRARDTRHDYDWYIELLEPSLAAREGGASLHNGWLGSYWATCRIIQLREQCSFAEATELVAVDPDELEDAAEDANDYELGDGLVGIVACLREANRSTRARVGRIVARKLDEMASHDEDGRPRWATPVRRQARPVPAYDLGLYHGNPGVLVAMAWLRDDLGDLPQLNGFAEWLSSVCGSRPAVPAFVGSEATRTAWCYGHPGVGCALLRAGIACNDPALFDHSIQVLARVAKMTSPDSSHSPFWCHGSAGLLYMFWSLSRASDEIAFREARDQWESHLLSQIEELQARDWPGGLGLVDGLAGIGMCLLAIAGMTDTRWERVMGLDFSWVEERNSK